ncbi:MAG: hypothetical protein EXS14_09095 [Planctomycetes bacterium]|nr:hypothetical protein [Planctomycetota bacterium]
MILRTLVLVSLIAIVATAQLPTALNISVSSGSSSVVQTTPGTLNYSVTAELSNTSNEGLAALVFDLVWSAGPIAQATPGASTTSLRIPLGVNNPAGFGGTVSGNRLKQVGGAQNTINNTIGAYPNGAVVTMIAQTGAPLVVVTGSVNVPAAAGNYTLAIENVWCNVIRQGDLGVPFWNVDPAALGSITNLAVNCSLLSSATSSISIAAGGAQNMTLTAGSSFGNTAYFVGGSTSGTSPGTVVSPSLVIPLNLDWYTDFTISYANSGILSNNLGTLSAAGSANITFSLPGNTLPAALAGLVISHAATGLPPNFVSNAVNCVLTP